MSVLEALLHPSLLLALTFYGLLNLGLIGFEHRWQPRMSAHWLVEWIAEHIVLPVARIAVLLVFIGAAYPALFGVAEAPALFSLLDQGEHRINTLINAAFLASLLFPLLPLLGGMPGVVLPVQGIAASGLLFSWLANSLGFSITLWPGWATAGMMLAWAELGHRLAVWSARGVGSRIDAWGDYIGAEKLVYDLIILFLQAPAILVYTLSLGQQLRP
jgi:hypothetical protein